MITLKSARLSQPQGRAEIDWGNPIAAQLSAAALATKNGVFSFSKNLPVEPFVQPNGSDIATQVSQVGIGIGRTAATTQTVRLSTTSNLFNTAWEEPNSQVTFAALVTRYGDTAGNAPIFGNQAPSTPPYTAWQIIDRLGTGTFQVACSAGGTVREFDMASGLLPNNSPMMLVGRYNGSILESFKNGIKSSGGLTCSGSLVYPSKYNRGPSICNFYNYTNGQRAFNGVVFMSAVWPVALSDAEIESFSANPWQIFK